MTGRYIGRFAPSPSGPLHQGSLIAAMASYLDAKAHDGQWLIRIEDLDFDRNVAGADQAILQALARCGMHADAPIVWQSQRIALYEHAFSALHDHIYPCACSRKEIADSRIAAGTRGLIYPGTCRNGLPLDRAARAWRLRVPDDCRFTFDDRWHGRCEQDVAQEVGDFVLKRADGFWAYQLAVVIDDAEQGITDVVRGSDLLDSTARQILLQHLLELPQPRYLHIPVLNNQHGEKLSKQTGAQAFDAGLQSEKELIEQALLPAAHFLGLHLPGMHTLSEFWTQAERAWASHRCNEVSMGAAR